MAFSTSNTSVLNQQQNHHSQSPSPLHFNSSNNASGAQQQQQINYVASSPKHNHHQNLASPVNYMTNYVASSGGGGVNVCSVGGGGVNSGGSGSIGALGSDSGSNSNLSYPPNFVSFITTANSVTTTTVNNSTPTPTSLAIMTVKSHKCVQTDITTNQMIDSASAIETKNTRIDELMKEKDELNKEIMQVKRDYEKQGFNFKKCLSVNKKLLIEKVRLTLVLLGLG